MGSSSSLLDESKSNYIRGRTEAELKNFSPHYRRQYCVAFFSQLQDEVEQHRAGQTQLLKQRGPPEGNEVLYKDTVLHYDDSRKWKERLVLIRADYSMELHDSQETFAKGVPPRHKILPTGGTVLTSEEKYMAIVDKAFPDLNSGKEDSSGSMVAKPGPFPVYLRLPYRRDSYFCFHQEEQQSRFIAVLSDCIRHQNHDSLKGMSCEVQAFLKAIHFYRQEKGHYESWDMLIGSDAQVLANQVMEELIPSLQTELLPKLKGKKAERKRVWFATVEATYALVQEQLSEGLQALKEECREAAKKQEALIRSDMDQIINSRTFLETKLQSLVSEPAMKFSSESVAPYLASILEELMGPVSSGFQAVRLQLEGDLTRLCKDFPEGGGLDELKKALEKVRCAPLVSCYQHVEVLKEQLQELRNRFKFYNTTLLVQSTQNHMQQLMDNAVHTFELLLQSSLKDKPDKLASVMEKAKLRVLKQYDYDSSTVRKKIFQESLMDITLPAIRRNLAPTCKTELQKFEQYIFADYTNFIQVENVYEDILTDILNNEVNKVVKEAASLKKHNLFVDSTDLQCISQSSLSDSRTPPRSAPASPAKVPSAAVTQKEETPKSPLVRNGNLESQDKKDRGLSAVEEGTESHASEPPNDAKESQTVTLSDPVDIPAIIIEVPSTTSVPTCTTDTSKTKSESPLPETDIVSATPDAPTICPPASSSQPEISSSIANSAPLPTPDISSPEASEEPVTNTLVNLSLSTTPLITVPNDSDPPVEQQQITDRAVYLNPPAGLTAGTPVPTADLLPEGEEMEMSGTQVSGSLPEDEKDTVVAQAEVCNVEIATGDSPSDVKDDSAVQSDLTPEPRDDITIPTDQQTKEADSASPVQISSCDSTHLAEDVSEVVLAGAEKTGMDLDANNVASITYSPAGDSVPPASEPMLECTASPARGCPSDDSDQDNDEPLDSVKTIRDLVVEIIEVEDIVTPCPDSGL
ncbi:protein Niban 1 [Chanos chanos]|uniref:Protein Niban 1 n=1 Tax=Chanos chanos TaxID=29144 RepID=A0A6J2VCL7_CHACN|nr:protein Niban 1-like [Chanos chanos]